MKTVEGTTEQVDALKGTGFSTYIKPAKTAGALQAAEKLDSDGGGGFNPRITPAESMRAKQTAEKLIRRGTKRQGTASAVPKVA
jgi:hypothetical protein